MKIAASALSIALLGVATTHGAFVSHSPSHSVVPVRTSVIVRGYLDKLDVTPDDDTEERDDSRDATKEKTTENAGPQSFDNYVDFGDEFDGGDGQMGVAGDGNKSLTKMGNSEQMAKSKFRSAKNAWGTSSGYADELIASGVELQRAQQLENWRNQQEVLAKKKEQRFMTEAFDQVQATGEEDWRALAKFGVERNTETNLDDEFGAVAPGDEIEGTITLSTNLNRVAVHELSLKNPYMGFADFRAAFTSETPLDWTVTPTEGSIQQREETEFIIKFKPQNPGLSEGYLVIETEDFKKTWKLIGNTA
mmetsp:Transcript_10677/g.19493  ORF Transcript_10677/g.19493 Transcript_10677/m.19493 type:complete len:306 (-) Transcript_10677:355-1272(-)|eukprot:CAMPEP_0198305104 /NCGR_PEP_ID=MMETSP1449-20131203/57734_1 /TAXON_ID=420275 /ORGANISM="Attheya septentrionalis, Strain CCMP2084" /LENGTH=305 /DNA_ID=CAMNT_0044007635 /DNA_START=755 /DNA_END=1672 /DNA_ORIENTATION=-